MKNNLIIISGLLALFGLQGCTAGGDNPGVEYAPDMYVSKGYESMSQLQSANFMYVTRFGDTVTISENKQTQREPVKGTIATDLDFENGDNAINNFLAMEYPYPKNDSGKALAKMYLKNPIKVTPKSLEKGRKSFTTYCSPCHGLEGLGDGTVAAKFPPNNIPSYKSDRILNLSDGEAYHSITYGLNFMGSYASVLTPEQRWEVINYINFLKNN